MKSEYIATFFRIYHGGIELEILKCNKLTEKNIEMQTLISQAFEVFLEANDDTFDDEVKQTLEKFKGHVSAGLDSASNYHTYTKNEEAILFELSTLLLSDILRHKEASVLSKSESNKIAVIKSMQDIVFVLDNNLIYRECYSPESELLYVSPEVVIGKHIDDMNFPEPALGIIKVAMEKALYDGDPMRVEYYLDLEKGRFWFDAQIAAISEADGTNGGIVCIARDITEKKEAEKKLEESEENFRTFFETMDDLVFVGDQQGEIYYSNSSVSKKLGYTSKELQGMNMLDFHPKNVQSEARDILKNICEGQKNICPFPLVTKNGDYLPAETQVWLGIWDGRKCIFAVSKDLSKEQEALQKFNSLFDNNPALMAVSTMEERVLTEVNNSFLEVLGYSKGEVIGRTSKQLNIFCENEKLDEFSEKLKKNGSVSNCELKVRTKSGQILYGVFFGETVESQGKKHFLTVMTDITYRKKAEEALYSEVENRRILLDNIHTQVWYLKNEYTYGSVNKAHASFNGLKKYDIAFKNMYDIFPKEVVDICRISNQKVFNGEKIYYEKWLTDFTGKSRLIAINKSPVFAADAAVAYAVCSGEDITERKQMEEEIYIEKELFKTTLLSVGDGVISTDNNGNIMVMNKVAEKLTGWDKTDAFGKPFEEVFKIINGNSRKICENPVKIVLQTGDITELENNAILISKNGLEVFIEDSAAPIKDSDGKVTGVVIVFKDFTEKKEKQKQIEYLSFNDHLTGLYNRRYLENSLKYLDIHENWPLTIMILDVNGLKLTNDAFGHQMGDKLLKTVADIIKNSCRDEDVVCRIGGDEFAILMPDTDEKRAYSIREEIINVAAKTKLDSTMVSLAIGYAVKKNDDEDIENIKKIADNNMYKDKLKYGKIMRSKTIETVMRTINSKYMQEQIHTERVSQYCEAIARELNLDKKEVEKIRMAGILHDIGKIMLPSELLNKSEKLTVEEFELIKRHPEAGYQILKSVDEYSTVAELILYHHERFDGDGYTEGLRGEEIPYGTRILSVADAYEAMTAKRSYQRTKTREEAILEMRKHSGTQFDPAVVEVFLEKVLKVI